MRERIKSILTTEQQYFVIRGVMCGLQVLGLWYWENGGHQYLREGDHWEGQA